MIPLVHAFKKKRTICFTKALHPSNKNIHWNWPYSKYIIKNLGNESESTKIHVFRFFENKDNTSSYQQHGANATGRRLRKVKNIASTQPSKFRAKDDLNSQENMTNDNKSPSKGNLIIDLLYITFKL